MYIRYIIILLYYICWASFPLGASPIAQEEKPTDSLYQNISLFSTLNPQEKVYLHFDNTSYFMRESIWYKANIVNAETLIPEVKSKILYVDLFNQEGVIVKRNRHYIKEGMCSGSFYLPDTLNAGYYEVRAYTAWMLNFGRIPNIKVSEMIRITSELLDDPDAIEKRTSEVPSIFSRVFPIYNAVNNNNYQSKQMRTRPRINRTYIKKEKEEIIVSFFPEGGHLIENVNNRVAFELRNQEGAIISPQAVFIKAVSGEILDTLQLIHNGRGTFETKQHHWIIGLNKCHLTFSYKNKKYEFALPKPEKNGASLRLNVNESLIDVQIISRNIASPLYITLQYGGNPIHHQSLDTKGITSISFPTAPLRQGVHQLTIYDSTGHIWADRLFFVWKQETTSITFQGKTSTEKRRQSYNLEQFTFHVKDTINKKLPNTFFSVSVRDNDIEDLHYNAGNILTNLLLSSEIRGFIQSPEYYFESQDPHRLKALDLLMMIQGWRRYDWQMMAGVKTFKPHYPIEQKLQVKGSVYKRRSSNSDLKKWKKEVFVRCQICYPNGYTYDAVQQTKNGDFSFDVIQIYGKHPMFIQAYKTKDKIKKELDYHKRGDFFFYDHYVCKDREFPPLPKQYDYYETHEKDIYGTSLFEQAIDQLDVKKRGKIGIDFSKPDFCYDFIEAIDYCNDFGYEYNRSLTSIPFYIAIMTGNNQRASLHICTNNGEDEYYPPPPFHQSDSEKIRRDIIFQFKRMENICGYFDLRDRSRYIGKKEIQSGKWDVYVNYTQRAKKEYLPDMVGDRCYFYGYAPSVEFYSPDYNSKLPDKPDHRRTLYWNPNIKTDENGNASIQFYNNSTCKKMIISAEGITKDGQPFYLNIEK